MRELLSAKVRSFLCDHNLTGARLVLAVSGGPDSACLLHALTVLKEELAITLQVAHLDHGLREDSAADAASVAQLAEGLGLPVVIERVDVQRHRQASGQGLEEAAREVRYCFLARLARELCTPYVVTGHTLSDQVETVLLHLVRGTGLQGLVGLKPLTPLTIDGHKVILVRPLLAVKRSDTEGYCREVGIKPCQDITNRSLTPLRNRIRLKLLPQLREYNPCFDEAILRLATAAEIDLNYLEVATANVREAVVREVDGALALDKIALQGLPQALQRHLLRWALGCVRGGLEDIEARHVDNIMSSLGLSAGRRLSLPGGVILAVDYDCYWLGQADNLPNPYPVISSEYPLSIPGVTHLPGWQVDAELVSGQMKPEGGGLVAYFDLDVVGRGLFTRSWQPGDRFVPLGQTQDKKLGEFMIAQKVPRRWRERIPLVVSSQQIAWLVGYRLDDRVKVTDATRHVLRLEFKKV